ncbi:MAG: hypothetical protein ACU836_14040 [Gammaproteobacteria bacterium]
MMFQAVPRCLVSLKKPSKSGLFCVSCIPDQSHKSEDLFNTFAAEKEKNQRQREARGDNKSWLDKVREQERAANEEDRIRRENMLKRMDKAALRRANGSSSSSDFY